MLLANAQDNNLEPMLITLVVLTFNQEDVIIDALNSTLYQDYKSLELIICDDASIDGTVDLCSKWISRHEDSFHNVHHIINPTNLGIFANLHKGISMAKGCIIKPLAGDNVLAPAAVKNAALCFKQPDVDILFGNVHGFRWERDHFEITDTEPRGNHRFFFSLSPTRQFRVLAVKCYVYEPGVFYKKEIIQTISNQTPYIQHIEDWAKWLVASREGLSLKYENFDSVYYRRHVPKHINPEYREQCRADISKVIENLILPFSQQLSLWERITVKVNAKKHNLCQEENKFHLWLFETLFGVLRGIALFVLIYAPRFFSKKSDFLKLENTKRELKLPFTLITPIEDEDN